MGGEEGGDAPDFLARLTGGADRRAPQPLRCYGLGEAARQQIDAILARPDADPERPLIAVDADEVLLHFARHLQRFTLSQGVRLDLSAYRLDGGFTRLSDGETLSREEGWRLIDLFFAREAERQEPVSGAAEALAALAAHAEILVLTNVPAHAADARRRNLAAHGAPYPLVANTGGKGRALRYLWDRTRGAMAFIDDSPQQIRSAAARAPGVTRLHFVADDDLRRLAGACPEADASPASWAEIQAELEARILR